MVADRAGLAPCSVSAILNNSPASKAIPQSTKERVFRVAAELKYRPNLWARSLRTKRTRMVAAVAHDFGRGAVARIVAGAQSRLHERGYLLALGTLDSSDESQMSAHFEQRGIEGVIAIETLVPAQVALPVASVELGYMAPSEALSKDSQAWLGALGESAAETIVRQIEQEGISRRVKVDAEIPPVYFGVSSTRLAAGVTARESA